MTKKKNNSGDIRQNEKISKPAEGLYVVSTPIGNLGDITFRAIEILKSADAIVCEDTRVTQKLLNRYGIKGSLHTYNDHNATRIRSKLFRMLLDGKVLALVSDAGTPLISDPGYKLVKEARDKNIAVYTVPGPSALISALTIAGLPTDRFMFCGFLPEKTGARKTLLESLSPVEATLVFYESANKLAKTLDLFCDIFGDSREMVIARELTKKFEEVLSGKPRELLKLVGGRKIKGEIVILLSPPEEQVVNQNDIDNRINKILDIKGIKDISNIVHEDFGGSKKQIYERVIELKDAKK